MGWQDRDWAKWTDDERRRFFGVGGGSFSVVPGAFLAVVVSLVGLVVFARPGGVSIFHLGRAHSPSFVYGTGLAVVGASGAGMTCTAIERDSNGTRCTAWTILRSGQRPAAAAPLENENGCLAAEADQQLGRWVCTRVDAGAASA